jgi:hypothetical protein
MATMMMATLMMSTMIISMMMGMAIDDMIQEWVNPNKLV